MILTIVLLTVLFPASTLIAATTPDRGVGLPSFTQQAVALKSLTVTPKSVELEQDAMANVVVTATYGDNTSIDVTALCQWKSSNNNVATAISGTITGNSKGNAVITAQYISNHINIPVKVEPKLAGILLKPETETVCVGKKISLNAYALYENDSKEYPLTSNQLAWVSSSLDNATVNNGTVTGIISGDSPVTITASYKGMTAVAAITVIKPFKSISVDSGKKIEINQNETRQIAVTATYADNTTEDVTGKCNWNSSKQAIATVSKTEPKGDVTGVLPGTAVITAEYGGKKANVTAKIDPVVDSIAINPQSISVMAGKSQTLKLYEKYLNETNLFPINVNLANWESSDTQKVTVNASAKVTGLSVTDTPVMITATYNGKTTTAQISVTPTGEADIGPEGGTLVSADEHLMLTIPQGALSKTIHFISKGITNKAYGGIGQSIQISPEGTTFAVPVTMTFTLDDDQLSTSDVADSLNSTGIAYLGTDKQWHWVTGATYDATAKTVTVQTTHLSNWSPVYGEQLSPLSTTVDINDTVTFNVIGCYAPNSAGTFVLGHKCDTETASLTTSVKEWAVNGIVGGNATVGTISGSGLSATYTAPAQKPSPGTVDVTARLDSSKLTSRNAVVFSHVTITEPHKTLDGKIVFDFNWLFAYPFHVEAYVSMVQIDDGLDQADYKQGKSGTSIISPATFIYAGGYICTIDNTQAPVPTNNGFMIRKQPQLAARFGYAQQWTYHCTYPNMPSQDVAIILEFATRTSQCNAPVDVPFKDATEPKGTFTDTCSPGGNVTATWDLQAY